MQFAGYTIPKTLQPCPIVESVVKIRFDSSLPDDAVFGIVFNKCKDRFSFFEKLPIMDLPSYIRENDTTLKYAPYYRMKNDNFILQIGSKSISIAHYNNYKGWEAYFNEISYVFKEIESLNLIENISRVGVRFINFFENTNIFKHLKLTFCLAGNDLLNCNNVVRTEFPYNKFNCVIQIAGV